MGVHRAKPAINKAHKRASLFFQVDSEDNSEPLFINPSFINDMNDELKYFLGFGRKSSYKEFPVCSSKNLPLKLIVGKVFLPWAKESLFLYSKNLFKFLVPKSLFKYIKRRFG